ncbi:MAG: hypothetical protein U0269_06530 [Polyangiales bacterium]
MVRTKTPSDSGSSTLLLSEYFDAGDERFLPELIASNAARKLQVFGPRWYADKRRFAREALLAYIDDGCDRPHHRPLVKKLFKHAESAGDDEAMAHFLVAFDRIAPRVMVSAKRRVPGTYTRAKTSVLRDDPALPHYRSVADRVGRFTMKTRRYLQRRAWRYLRAMSKSQPVEYLRVLSWVLAQYNDEQFDPPQRLLDCWGLVHALFWGNDALRRTVEGVRVGSGRSMAELRPAPYAEELWSKPYAFEPLFILLLKAQSAMVRTLAVGFLERSHMGALRELGVDQLVALLKSPNAQAQTLSAKLLDGSSGLERLSVNEWLELLEVDNPFALPVLCKLVLKHVSPSRVTLDHCVRLAMSRPAPVAELGFEWLKARKLSTEGDFEKVLVLRNAPANVVRAPAVRWLLGHFEESAFAKAEHVRELLDSRFEDVRQCACESLATAGRFADEPTLWAALAESPYTDARSFLLAHLSLRASALDEGSLRHLWATVLLAVHRGSRAKQRAISQVAKAVAQSPDKADDLLPLLAVALRSVRAPERRAGIAAIAQAVVKNPSLARSVNKHIAELDLGSMVEVSA